MKAIDATSCRSRSLRHLPTSLIHCFSVFPLVNFTSSTVIVSFFINF